MGIEISLRLTVQYPTMKSYISRWLYRLRCRQTGLTLLFASVFFMVYLVFHVKHEDLQELRAGDSESQQSSLITFVARDIQTGTGGLGIDDDFDFQEKNISDDRFSSPFVVKDIEKGSFSRMQVYNAGDSESQQSSLNTFVARDIQTGTGGLDIDDDFDFQEKNISDDRFSSPFVVKNIEKGTFSRMQVYNEPSNVVPEAARNKTFAIIWPCKGSPKGCFLRKYVPMETCRFQCQQTWVYEEADVVVLYAFRLQDNDAVPSFNRPHHQRWVMMTGETPVRWNQFRNLDFPALKGQFNWTMTYRLDSDIPFQYGRLQPQRSPAKSYEQIYRGKTITAAWFVSHCKTQSLRQEYVQRMQKIANVHVYGSCGNYTCGDHAGSKRNRDKSQCMPLLSRKYFFYLAFENSFCKDYVTEKLFKVFEDVDVIPVVRGGLDYKRNFPPNTFIDASDFKSPEELATFLLDVAKDKKRYISMLKEKNKYGVLTDPGWFCNLCEKMHKDDHEKYYPDLRQWFLRGQCHEPNDL